MKEVTLLVLTVENLSKNFKGLKAVNNLSMSLEEEEIVGIIGPNGAGKTTIFNLITGLLKPELKSKITFLNENITLKPSYKIARKGISRTFQKIKLFSHLTVLENVIIGAQKNNESGFLSTIFYGPKYRKNEQRIREYAIHILELFHISDLQNQIAGDLPYGTQRMVEISRAMASKPKLILLDEPVAGMNSEESISLSENIKDMKKKFKVTILLVEHDMSFVMGLCERIIVVNYGVKIAEGKPEEIRNDQAVIEAYLGRQNVKD